VKSENDFWSYSRGGSIYHYNYGEWQSFTIPDDSKYSRLQFCSFLDNEFICTGMDANWKTHFFYFRNNEWQKLDLVFRLPLQKIMKVTDSLCYAIGNFGTMLKYDGVNWSEIETPFKSHIQVIDFLSPSEIYLITEAEGVHIFNGEEFRQLHFQEEEKWDLGNIRVFTNGEVYLTDKKFQLYKLRDSLFIKTDNASSARVWSSRDRIGFRNFIYEDHEGSRNVFNVPPNYSVFNYQYLSDDSFLFSTSDYKIFHAVKTEQSYFNDLAKAFMAEGHSEGNTLSAVLRDFTGDELPDLFSITSHTKIFTSLLENRKDRPFLSRLSPAEYDEDQRFMSIHGIDFDKDYALDLLINNFDSDGAYLTLFRNDGAGSFSYFKRIDMPDGYNSHWIRNIRTIDYEGDGDIDINVTYYYGPKDKPGREFIFLNNRWGHFELLDSTEYPVVESWNTQSIFADFNNDDKNDWYIANRWRKNRLLIKKEEEYQDESELRFNVWENTENIGTLAFDYDNDGDLDIVNLNDNPFIQIFENDGNGYFQDVTAQLRSWDFNIANNAEANWYLSAADFNNDSFTDILLTRSYSKNDRNYLLLNDSAKSFIEVSDKFNIREKYAAGLNAGDIDDDGDIDIYGFRNGSNSLWINNLNNENYLKIKPVGVISNSEGWGAKVWVYEEGHLGESAYLKGYKQIGSELYGNSAQNETIAHFGLPGTKKYDIKIKFFGGEEKYLYSVNTGQKIEVHEISKELASIYLIPGNIYKIVRDKEIQLYSLSALLIFLIMFLGTRFGIRKFQWDNKLSTGLVVVNLSLFWILLIAGINAEDFFVKHVMAPLLAAIGIFIPNVIFYWMKKSQYSMKNKETLYEELLELLISYSHVNGRLETSTDYSFCLRMRPAHRYPIENTFHNFQSVKILF
jgi:hypothetical protein